MHLHSTKSYSVWKRPSVVSLARHVSCVRGDTPFANLHSSASKFVLPPNSPQKPRDKELSIHRPDEEAITAINAGRVAAVRNQMHNAGDAKQ